MTQQEFLRDAMLRLGMTRQQFALRIGTNIHALNKWLQPSESKNFRKMTDVVWKFVGEILDRETLKVNLVSPKLLKRDQEIDASKSEFNDKKII